MRIIKRGVGKPLTAANNVSVKTEKISSDRILAAQNKPGDKPVYPNRVLEELSAAAQDALKQADLRTFRK